MNGDLVIKTESVNKYFGKFHALKDISLSVYKGDIYGFIGKNGAGKTTFMRMLCGLMRPTSGSIEILGEKLEFNSSSNAKRKIGFLPQNVRFNDNVNALEIITFFGKLRDDDCRKSLSLAKELELDMKRSVRDLSPGNQRKLQLIIATIGTPDILILDEPTAGLDPLVVQQVRDIIRTLNKEGCTIFISTHVLAELDNLCEKIAVIEEGKLLFQGRCRSTYEIEVQGEEKQINKLDVDIREIKYSNKESKIYVNIERDKIPELLEMFYEKKIKVFSVKPLSLEFLYNGFIRGKHNE